MTKKISILIICIILCSCISKKGYENYIYYRKDRSETLYLEKDSTFRIRKNKSMYKSNGIILGNYSINSKKELIIYNFIDRINLPINLKEKSNERFNIEILTEESPLNYKNVSVFAITNEEEFFLGYLNEGLNKFEYKNSNDSFRIVFKYLGREGMIYESNSDFAQTQLIFLNGNQHVVFLNFKMIYFDLIDINNITQKTFKLKNDIFR